MCRCEFIRTLGSAPCACANKFAPTWMKPVITALDAVISLPLCTLVGDHPVKPGDDVAGVFPLKQDNDVYLLKVGNDVTESYQGMPA